MADDTPNRPPNAQPNPANKDPGKYCAECKNKCTESKIRAMYYGCWCGPERAPAGGDMEKQIPQNEKDWPGWVKKEGLPQPKDKVDECCMYHDLRLGKARQSDPDAGFSRGSMTVAGINQKMSWCLRFAALRGGVSPWGRAFGSYASGVFNGMSGWNAGGAGFNYATGSGPYASAGGATGSWGSAGAGGAASSAGASGGW